MSLFFIITSLLLFSGMGFVLYGLFSGKLAFGEYFFAGIDNFLHGLNDWFGKSAGQHCRLETTNDPFTLIADDGSLVSIIELQGSSSIVGEEEYVRIMASMSNMFNSQMSKSGHSVQVSMHYDPDEVAYEIKELMRASRNTARNLGLEMVDMMDDWEASIAKWCASEHTYISLWTRPQVLSPVQKKSALKNQGNAVVASPKTKGCQVIAKGVREIEDEHRSIVDATVNGFSQAGLLSYVMDSHDALWMMRRFIDRDYTGRGWRALLPGDPLPSRVRDAGESDLSGILYPKIGQQIFPRPARNHSDNVVVMGNDAWHGTVAMTVPPQTIMPFNVLFKNMLNTGIPWRISFLMHSNGIEGTFFKQTIASLLHYTSTNNKLFNKSIDLLKQKVMSGSSVATFQCALGTSVYSESNKDEASRKISEQLSILSSNTQSWGSCDVRNVVGDPILGLNSTLPGIMPSCVGPKAVAPFDEAVLMLPITRPASLWRKGNVIFRTSDGKIMPYQMGSSLQAAWVDLGVSPMGGGKSVLLNTLNYAFCTQEGLSRMPWLSILDIGPSSSGLIELIRSSLPDDKKYLAQYHRLRMEARFSINPFDLPLGMSKPTPAHRSFLVNFLSLLGTEIREDAPIDGVSAIARACIDAAYQEFSPSHSPKPYQPNVDEEVDKLVKGLALHIDRRTTWYEIRDELFKQGYIHEATRAQRFAVPLLSEVASMAKRDIITGIYKHFTPNGEPVTDFFWRQCVDAIGAYPLLGDPSRFDIGDAQIVSLDLDEVAPRGGAEADRQTAVMYMLGRHLLASRFFLMPEDARLADEGYKEWHVERIDNMRQDPKRFCLDEVHRAIRNASVAKQVVGDIETISRESRKWNLSLGIYSQSIEDFPEIIVELATSLYILGVGTARMAERIAKMFGLNDTALIEMQRLGMPDKRGSNFLGIFKAGGKTSVHRLTNTIGNQALWAFDTTTENVTVRNKLYALLGATDTLKLLARLYPGGIKPEIEKRKAKFADMTDDVSVDIIKELVIEIAAQNKPSL